MKDRVYHDEALFGKFVPEGDKINLHANSGEWKESSISYDSFIEKLSKEVSYKRTSHRSLLTIDEKRVVFAR